MPLNLRPSDPGRLSLPAHRRRSTIEPRHSVVAPASCDHAMPTGIRVESRQSGPSLVVTSMARSFRQQEHGEWLGRLESSETALRRSSEIGLFRWSVQRKRYDVSNPGGSFSSFDPPGRGSTGHLASCRNVDSWTLPSSFCPLMTRKSGGDVKTDRISKKFFLPYSASPSGPKERIPASSKSVPVTNQMVNQRLHLLAWHDRKRRYVGQPFHEGTSANSHALAERAPSTAGQECERASAGHSRVRRIHRPKAPVGRRLATIPRHSSPRTSSWTLFPPVAQCDPCVAGTTKRSPGHQFESPGPGRPHQGRVRANWWRR